MTESLERRLKKLETANRRTKLGGVVALAVMGVAMLTAMLQKPELQNIKANEIEARMLVIRDAAGTVRFSVGVRMDDAVDMGLSNAAGDSLMRISIVGDTPEIALMDKDLLNGTMTSLSNGLLSVRRGNSITPDVSLATLTPDSLTLYHGGHTRLLLGRTQILGGVWSPTSNIMLFDEERNVIFQEQGR